VPAVMSSKVALKSFSLTNKILDVAPQDEIYRFDAEANKKLNREAPWTKEWVSFCIGLLSSGHIISCSPHYFKSCKISAIALIKMVCTVCAVNVDLGPYRLKVIHARSGVPYEIMGLMQGKVVGTSIVVMDSFALPVQGTETRVNAANEANEYMVEYIGKSEKVRLIHTQVQMH